MKSKLMILGTGHLMGPLLKTLCQNYQVLATTRSTQKKDFINQCGAQHLTLDLPSQGPGQSLSDNLDFLIISTPPLRHIEQSLPTHVGKRVIFISSTSVYGSQGVCDEDSQTHPESENGKILKETESKLRDMYPHRLTIIRPGGLIDHDRHPGKFLSARPIKDPWERIHLIHEDDVRSLILEVLNHHSIAPDIINCINPSRELKWDFYNHYTKKMGLPPVILKEDLSSRPVHDHFKRDISSKYFEEFMGSFTFSKLD